MSCLSRTCLPSKTTVFFKIPWYHETALWKSLHVAVLISFRKGTAIMGIVMLLSSFPMWLHQITMVGNSFYTTCIYTTYMYLYTCVHLSIHHIWYIYRDTCISQDCFTMSELGPNLCERDGATWALRDEDIIYNDLMNLGEKKFRTWKWMVDNGWKLEDVDCVSLFGVKSCARKRCGKWLCVSFRECTQIAWTWGGLIPLRAKASSWVGFAQRWRCIDLFVHGGMLRMGIWLR